MISMLGDPILRAPLLGSMLMSMACALLGVLVFIRRESLLGETLSHATYPGIMLGSLIAALSPFKSYPFWGLLGAGVSCGISLVVLKWTRKALKLSEDSALCFVLTLFFGLGLTLASYLQTFNSLAYKHARIFLFGQAATITDQYLYLYALFAASIVLFLILCYRSIQIVHFDRLFANCVGIRVNLISAACSLFLITAIALGIRSIGLLLLSGMLIGPAVAARQWSNKLSKMLVIAATVGAASGYLGIYLSEFIANQTHWSVSLASGPTILMVSAAFALFSLVFAPKRGWVMKSLRRMRFRLQCNQENILKSLWHLQNKNPDGAEHGDIFSFQSFSRVEFWALVYNLGLRGQIVQHSSQLLLTSKGRVRAERIVRMHRLWELYLVYLGVEVDRVHHNAEEMEHIITPQIEKELLNLMDHPTKDPHDQPIPLGGVLC